MIPMLWSTTLDDLGIPRESGDDPLLIQDYPARGWYSPRERG